MRYLLAIVLPPIGMLSVGKPFQALLCMVLMLTILGWPFASIWAVLAVHDEDRPDRGEGPAEDREHQHHAQQGLEGLADRKHPDRWQDDCQQISHALAPWHDHPQGLVLLEAGCDAHHGRHREATAPGPA